MGLVPEIPKTELKSPVLPSRNFHTLPLTTGGSAHMNTIRPRSSPVPRAEPRKEIAAASPPIRPSTVTIPTKTRVLLSTVPSVPSAKPLLKFENPTKSQLERSVAGVTSLTLIRSSWISGETEKMAMKSVAGITKTKRTCLRVRLRGADGADKSLLPTFFMVREVNVGTIPPAYFLRSVSSPDITLSAASFGVSCPPNTALHVWPTSNCTPATFLGGMAVDGYLAPLGPIKEANT